MSAKVKPIPEGHHTVTPYLFVRDGAKALEFYAKAFNARECVRMPGPGGMIMHAEMKIGDSVIMLADENPQIGNKSPQSLGGTSVLIALYVEDVDKAFAQAISAGGKAMRPVNDQFYGDRAGSLVDPFGHLWHLATHIEDVAPEEMERRAAECMKKGQGG
jgi:PhnB protein